MVKIPWQKNIAVSLSERAIMNKQEIMNSEDFVKCVDFHGHICPGLSIGYKAAKMAMEKLKEGRADDEEIVAIVETDACSADAVQVLTGCTFGKGNFIYKDHGKMVLTLLSRKTGKGIRVAMRPDAFSTDEIYLALLHKLIRGEANEEQKNRFYEIHIQRSRDVLEMPDNELFAVTTVQVELPEKARIEPSEPCARCGEPTMRTKLETIHGRKFCRDCI
jgi:formylmethanofuran dehydrogenase subunit E